MAHVAMQEADEQGQVVTWLDDVTDEEYALTASVVTVPPRHVPEVTRSTQPDVGEAPRG
jgi:hypothetical protein